MSGSCSAKAFRVFETLLRIIHRVNSGTVRPMTTPTQPTSSPSTKTTNTVPSAVMMITWEGSASIPATSKVSSSRVDQPDSRRSVIRVMKACRRD